MGAAAGMAVLDISAAPAAKKSIIELRYIRMRNTADNQMQRTTDFLKNTAAPALKRAGAGPLGFFMSVIAPDSPFILALAAFPGMAAMETAREKEAADQEYIRGRDAYNSGPGLSYERLESSLLRCFDVMPAVEPPPNDGKRASKIFELRMCESNNGTTLARKINMFNEGEAGIFKRLGMQPVFFAETLVGARMPSLVYMLSYDDLAARDRLWKAFGSDAEWLKLRAQPGYSDAEIVSNISNTILRPLPFSDIR